MVLRVKEDIFISKDEAIMAYEVKEIDIHAKINVRMFREVNGVMQSME